MANYKVTFSLQSSVFGPSESYITNDITESELGPYVQRLIGARNRLLYNTVNWINVRIGLADGTRRSTPYKPGSYSIQGSGIELTVPSKGTLTPAASTDDRQDQARATLNCRVIFNTDRPAVRYLGLIPDNILGDEPNSYSFTRNPTWGNAFVLWQQELTSGRWNVWAQNRDAAFAQQAIIGWVQSAAAPNLMGAVLPSVPPPGIARGNKVHIYGTRRKGDTSISYNGDYVVDSVNTTQVPDAVVIYLRGTETADPTSIRVLGTIRRIAYRAYTIGRYYPVNAGIHKRGAPPATPRGRRSTRQLLA